MPQGELSAILSTFIKLPFVIKIFVLSIFEWPFYTGFAVLMIIPPQKRRYVPPQKGSMLPHQRGVGHIAFGVDPMVVTLSFVQDTS